MKDGPVYIYGKHAVEEAQAHMPHVLKKVMTDVKGGGHGGYVAIVDTTKLLRPYSEFIKDLKTGPNTAVVVLAGLTDPHNVGAIIRSAAAFGFAGVILPEHGQASITSTVVKTSAGMVFRIPIVSAPSVKDALIQLKARGFTTYGLEGTSADSVVKRVFDTPTVFIVGNEGAGMSDEIKALCEVLLAIPMHPRSESLNAAAAAATVMYAWSTQHPESLI